MADTRINALSTATVSLSDDFLPIDGTTAGTKKLSAYNPSFGGNATVGGTLTVNGDVLVSTGGKAIYSQGYVTAKDVQVNLLSRGTNNGWTTGLHFYSSNTDYSATLLHNPGNGELQIYTNATSSNYTASDIALLINTSKQVQVKATTASTSTSSGALVVSGGVGVAGAINAGGTLRVVGSSQIIRVRHDAATIDFTNTAQDAYVAATLIGNTLQLSGNNGTGLTIGTTGDATFSNTVTVNTAGGMLRVVNSNSLQPRGLVSDNVGNFENSGTVHLRKARGTESAKTAVLAGDSIGNVAFSGWDGTAYQLHEGIFQVRAAENFGTGHYGTYMQWQLIKANTGYTVYEAMRLTDSGNLLLGFGDNPTEGTGRLQLAAGAAGRASGLGFANDTWLYRSGANTLAFDTSGSAAVLNVRENGTLTAAIGTVTGDLYLQTQQAGKKVYIKTANAATAATFDENQKATFAATIKTAAPTGGTAAEWKLGTVATVSPTSPNRTIEVDIGGTIYYLAAKTTNN
jgi:hypothetical protein